jgi:hypothetical protein
MNAITHLLLHTTTIEKETGEKIEPGSESTSGTGLVGILPTTDHNTPDLRRPFVLRLLPTVEACRVVGLGLLHLHLPGEIGGHLVQGQLPLIGTESDMSEIEIEIMVAFGRVGRVQRLARTFTNGSCQSECGSCAGHVIC